MREMAAVAGAVPPPPTCGVQVRVRGLWALAPGLPPSRRRGVGKPAPVRDRVASPRPVRGAGQEGRHLFHGGFRRRQVQGFGRGLALFAHRLLAVFARLGVVWAQCQGAVVIPDGGGEVALTRPGNAPIVEGDRIVGIKGDGAVQVADRRVMAAQHHQGAGPVVEGARVFGVECYGVVQVGHGGGVVLFAMMGAGAVDTEGRAPGFKGDGAAEIADCRVEPAPTIQDDTPVVDGGDVPRGERHGPAIVGSGGIKRPLAGMGVTPVLEGLGQGSGIPQAAVDQQRAGIDAAVGIFIAGAAGPTLGIGSG